MIFYLFLLQIFLRYKQRQIIDLAVQYLILKLFSIDKNNTYYDDFRICIVNRMSCVK